MIVGRKIAVLCWFLAASGLFVGVLCSGPSTTAFVGPWGQPWPDSVAELVTLPVGNTPQTLLIRGKDRRAPVVLFLHGGPGEPEMFLAPRFQRALEERFVMVHWDQRGAGKSYREDIDPASMTPDRFVADGLDVTEYLCRRFGTERIVLVGHSWGSELGMRMAAERPSRFAAFVGVGQVAREAGRKALQEAFIRRRAREAGRPEALSVLDTDDFDARQRWVRTLGGLWHGREAYPFGLLDALLAPEYDLADTVALVRGYAFTEAHFRFDHEDLADRVPQVRVPVAFFLGRHDAVVPSALAREYLQTLRAPRKVLVWFEHSAHLPFYEEPDHFNAELIRLLQDPGFTVLPRSAPR